MCLHYQYNDWTLKRWSELNGRIKNFISRRVPSSYSSTLTQNFVETRHIVANCFERNQHYWIIEINQQSTFFQFILKISLAIFFRDFDRRNICMKFMINIEGISDVLHSKPAHVEFRICLSWNISDFFKVDTMKSTSDKTKCVTHQCTSQHQTCGVFSTSYS